LANPQHWQELSKRLHPGAVMNSEPKPTPRSALSDRAFDLIHTQEPWGRPGNHLPNPPNYLHRSHCIIAMVRTGRLAWTFSEPGHQPRFEHQLSSKNPTGWVAGRPPL
jgi:hypothetical protein